jgi:hypothetical protein
MKVRLLVALITAIVLTTIGVNAVSPVYPVNAIYVWSDYYHIVSLSPDMNKFFGVCSAFNYNTVYLAMDSDSLHLIDNDGGYPVDAYQTFIAAAKVRGIKTYMTIGGTSANFAGAPLLVDEDYIDHILHYNIDNPTVAFDGIIWDIESLGVGDFGNYKTYIQTLKAVTHSGETIVTQNLTLAAYVDAYDTVNWRSFIHELDRVDINSYADGLTTGGDGAGVVGIAATGVTVCTDEGVDFSIGLDTSNTGNDPYTLFEEGYDAYAYLRNRINSYYGGSNYFSGQYAHSYDESIEDWYDALGSKTGAGIGLGF